jgi:hypothetical protein
MPSLLRTMALVVAAGFLSSCATTSQNEVGPQLPSLSSVVGGRFVSRVELDHGDLVVAPAPKTRPRVSAATAQALFGAADAVNGAYRFAVLGLGLATVSPDVSAAPPTTAPGTTTTSLGTGTTSTSSTSSTTTTTITAPTTTTTAAGTGPGSTEATGSTATTPTPPPTSTTSLPHYDSRLAWVGIAWGADCPARAGGARLATRYVAVVIDADTGRSVIAYTSRSSLACTGPVLPPSISAPSELVSVPWVALGPSNTSVRVTLPACSTYFGWTEVPSLGAATVQVVAREPFDSTCGSHAASTQTVDDVVPLGNAQAQVQHAKLGPVQGLRTLPGG